MDTFTDWNYGSAVHRQPGSGRPVTVRTVKIQWVVVLNTA